jgi:hypothetical protein
VGFAPAGGTSSATEQAPTSKAPVAKAPGSLDTGVGFAPALKLSLVSKGPVPKGPGKARYPTGSLQQTTF